MNARHLKPEAVVGKDYTIPDGIPKFSEQSSTNPFRVYPGALWN
ncbi:MAG: hypothetical protein QXN93_00990 [Methanomassiliicoccales archaeon]